MSKAWAIKLGSGGRCVSFCEARGIVGLGWRMVDPHLLASAPRWRVKEHVREVCDFYTLEHERGRATGQLFRFTQECQVGDYVLYYDPPKKHVVFCRVVSGPLYRDFDLHDETDIYHYRKVDYPRKPVPILDLYGPLKGSVLGPRASFWRLRLYRAVDEIARGGSPALSAAPDPELEAAYSALRELLLRRAETLNEKDWEWLVVDYFRAQGAHVDERRVGGSRPIIDAEARFDHGDLGEELWRIQVKRWQDRQIGWQTIQDDLEHVGDEARFCFVSVYGFTADARARADEAGVLLMEAGDFTRFLLGGKLRPKLREKLRLPVLDSPSGLTEEDGDDLE